VDHTPSVAFQCKAGSDRERELLTGDGLNVMVNDDGSVVIELYGSDRRRVGFRISSEDAKSQAHSFRRWSVLK
jgi:hypothetical protein